MNKFEFLNLIDEAIIVLNNKNEIIFRNNTLKRKFGNFESISKISNYFNFEICALNSDNIQNTTPINLLLESNENFFCFCNYQKSKDEYLYINLYSIKYKKFLVIFFKDVTSTVNLERSEDEINELEIKNTILRQETNKYAQLKQTAQEQVLKLAVLNRISTTIRESTEISEIINSAITEIHNHLGALKTYFAKLQGNKLKIRYANGLSAEDLMNTTIIADTETITNIKENKISINSCIKESVDSKKMLPKGTRKLIIPIYYKSKQFGNIISFTTHKISLEDNIDIFNSIATQLGNAIMQSELIDELNKKNKKLEKTLKVLKDTQLQLINSEKLASVGQLVAGVAHEINTPLACINSNNEIISRLLDKNEQLTDKKIKMFTELNNIDREAINRISNIVISLKRFIHLDEATYQEADINSEIDTTLKLIAYETKNKINIIKNYSKMPMVKCYTNMLNQVFINILINACHSFSDIERENKEITITTSTDDKFATISFKDNGKGMNQNIQKHIFEAGFTTKGIGKGTGLGLAICDDIIKMHKGSITFNSVLNQGSEFIIKIPVKM